jgi:hypothetical protein
MIVFPGAAKAGLGQKNAGLVIATRAATSNPVSQVLW